ncbi:hypothetical protein SAMN05421788_101838 [Filimonas lacunae]|uniref:LysM domain-containing protein n=1 Tax=Filimonas lacunae TaxID=477680 RepID=A0A173MP40_9BACT|nr:hypothetical protein [Filimonas lacunae]BAV09402.1 hypothetical protein FLA_5450 [Filimonas lacunae]SIS72494.1 hypothetical protein SAMN05421788_101838 [Filimonas lacunae]
MRVEVLAGQTLADLAIQVNGDVARIIDIALLNHLSITDDLQEDQFIEVPDIDSAKASIASVFENKSIRPASAIEAVQEDILEGISYWTIGLDFKVN